MALFECLYDSVIAWSRRSRAPWYLAMLSFAESSFFPIPPDVMLAPMSMDRPQRAWHYAALTTLASTLGGMAGYAIGFFALEAVRPLLVDWGYWPAYLQARAWFSDWGVWTVLVAGFSPIPYKVFTITAGSLAMAFVPFVIASAIGRGMRFFLVAGLLAWGGHRLERRLRASIEWVGWVTVLLLVMLYLVLRH